MNMNTIEDHAALEFPLEVFSDLFQVAYHAHELVDSLLNHEPIAEHVRQLILELHEVTCSLRGRTEMNEKKRLKNWAELFSEDDWANADVKDNVLYLLGAKEAKRRENQYLGKSAEAGATT